MNMYQLTSFLGLSDGLSIRHQMNLISIWPHGKAFTGNLLNMKCFIDENVDIIIVCDTVAILVWGRDALTHLPLDKMADVLETILSDAFSWMKILCFD